MNMEQFGNISNLLGLATFISSICAWIYSRLVHKQISAQLAQQEERIDIRLSDGQREIMVGQPRRKWLVRSEVNGLLGLLPRKDGQSGYVFRSINWLEVNKEIEEAQDGDTSQFIIQCTREELDQFDDEVIKPVL